MGAWIEINVGIMYDSENNVAPLVGAWIEINDELDEMSESLVAPLVGAWIEICSIALIGKLCLRRSPRGSVD